MTSLCRTIYLFRTANGHPVIHNNAHSRSVNIDVKSMSTAPVCFIICVLLVPTAAGINLKCTSCLQHVDKQENSFALSPKYDNLTVLLS